jgi:hypothetical protein
VGALLGIPEGVTQIALLPVAYTIGTDFARAPRRPARDVTFFDTWGHTWRRPPAAAPTLADGPGVVVEIDVDADPATVWALVTDINLPGRFSSEFKGALWAEGSSGPAVGARFVGTSQHKAVGEWQTTSIVVECVDERVFAWNVGDVDRPGAQWRFELEPLHGGRTRLRQAVTLGPGPSGLSPAIEAMPDKEPRILSRRLDEHGANIAATLAGIKELAERGEGPS